MALLGSDFDPTQPTGTGTPANQIDNVIRDIKARLKAWGTIYRDLETGAYKEGVIPSLALVPTGVTPGIYSLIEVNAQGQVIDATTATTLGDYGITDAESVTTMKSAQYGGTGLNASAAANGALFIGNGAGLTLATLTEGLGIKITNAAGAITLANKIQPWFSRATLTSAAALTPVSLIQDSDVPAGKKVILQGFVAYVNGATVWATTTEVKIQDTEGSPIDFVSLAVAGLTASAILLPSTANVTLKDAFFKGTGGTPAKGLQVKGDAVGTGSDLIVSAWGVLIDA